MKRRVFRPDLVIPGRPVLEVVVIPVLLDVLPFGSHLGRCPGIVVLRPQVVAVVRFIDGLNVAQEPLKTLFLATFIQQGGEGFIQFVEGLHSRENPV